MPDDTAPSLKDLVQTRFNEAPDVPLPDAPPPMRSTRNC